MWCLLELLQGFSIGAITLRAGSCGKLSHKALGFGVYRSSGLRVGQLLLVIFMGV